MMTIRRSLSSAGVGFAFVAIVGGCSQPSHGSDDSGGAAGTGSPSAGGSANEQITAGSEATAGKPDTGGTSASEGSGSRTYTRPRGSWNSRYPQNGRRARRRTAGHSGARGARCQIQPGAERYRSTRTKPKGSDGVSRQRASGEHRPLAASHAGPQSRRAAPRAAAH
jgi:hypothetical protein